MADQDLGWNRQRLEGYVDTTETLTVEFKSMRSLIADDKKDKNTKISEAAKDVAAMANEQGGIIIYGIEESHTGIFRRAEKLEDGFTPEHMVSREWFLQFIRDRVHPPLPDIDARDVRLSETEDRFALVVLVPQSIGIARQTDDLFFWRRDAQGLRKMTVQEIEDIRFRATRPQLDLTVFVQKLTTVNSHELVVESQFRVENPSAATASFAVITIGLTRRSSAHFGRTSEWRWVQVEDHWNIARCVLSSGSSSYWSPITPGFTLVAEMVEVRTPFLSEVDTVRPRQLGLVRLDHDGGSRLYMLVLHFNAELPNKLRIEAYPQDAWPDSFNDLVIPAIFKAGQHS